jgi:hypothetical protein
VEETMETIYDNNVTKLELEMLISCVPHKGMGNKDHYLKYTDIDTINSDLYRLFLIRDQAEKAETYMKKVKEPENIVYFF